MKAVTVPLFAKQEVLHWANGVLTAEGEPGAGFGHPDMAQVLLIVDRHGNRRGAAVFTNFNGHDIELTGIGRYVFSRSVCRAVCEYAFNQLQCARMTVIFRASRPDLQRVCERHGFRTEGVIRRRYGNEDGILMGMLRAECRWLPRTPANVEPITRARPSGSDAGRRSANGIEPRHRNHSGTA